MAYRPYTYVRNNSSWGATFHTKKGVLKRGPFPSDEPEGCGTLKPPPEGAGGGNEIFVLFWETASQKWKWGKLYYSSAVVQDQCGDGTGEWTYSEGPDGILGTEDDTAVFNATPSNKLIQTFSPLNTSINPCNPQWQFFGVYDAECEQNA